MFSLICTWTNGYANNRDAGDFRCHRTHYDITLMDRDFRRCDAHVAVPYWGHDLVLTTQGKCFPNFKTHWGWVTPDRRQAMIWTNAGILIIRTLGIHFSENLYQNSYIFIQENAFENVVCEIAPILSRPQCVKQGPDSNVIYHCIDIAWATSCLKSESIRLLFKNFILD